MKSSESEQTREKVEQIQKRVAAYDASAICVLAQLYYIGEQGFPQDQTKAMELYARSAELGVCKAHYDLGDFYYKGGDLKKAKFHMEAAAMAGDEEARYNLGCLENNSGNSERAFKHLTIAACAGCFRAMHALQVLFQKGRVSRESINTTLAAYNEYCAEMRSEARDACIRAVTNTM
jgi:TPR repeat protein